MFDVSLDKFIIGVTDHALKCSIIRYRLDLMEITLSDISREIGLDESTISNMLRNGHGYNKHKEYIFNLVELTEEELNFQYERLKETILKLNVEIVDEIDTKFMVRLTNYQLYWINKKLNTLK